jgi:asparagine N-glycosylation enzyme membrane subunit Stt3
VIAVRGLRMWGLWDPGRARVDAESRNERLQTIGVILFYPLALLALRGALVLRRRREPLLLLLAPVVMVTLVGLASYGSARLRIAAEIPVAILAAVALSSWRSG